MNKALLLAVNHGWACPPLDVLFSLVSQKGVFGVPVFLVVLAVLWRRGGADGVKLWLVLLAVIGLGDSLGNLVKHLALAPRPCAELGAVVRLVKTPFHVGCSHAPYGMPSNHSLNSFAAASFLALCLRSWRWGIAVGIVAATVAVSRIYLGVHYPSQVVVGTLMGIAIGSSAAWLVRRVRPAWTEPARRSAEAAVEPVQS